MAKVTMPQLGESVAEGTIGKWLKQPGDTVEKYEPLLEVITDKVNAEVPSPFAGILKEILVEEGATVPNNAEIAVIETADEASGGGTADATPASTPAPTAEKTTPKAEASTPKAEAKAPSPAPAPPTFVPADGPAGSDERPERAAASAAAPTAVAAEAARAGAEPSDAPGHPDARMTPAVRRLLREHGLTAAQMVGTGGGGRITREDVTNYVESQRTGQSVGGQSVGGATAATAAPAAAATAAPASTNGSAAAAAPAATPSAPAPARTTATTAAPPAQGGTVPPGIAFPEGADEVLVPMTQMRKGIAAQMTKALQAPHAYVQMEVDVTRLVVFREKSKRDYQAKEGIGLSFVPFVVKAVAVALKRNPTFNAHWTEQGVLAKRRVNIGVAVAVDEGLIVPVIRDADQLSIHGLNAAIADVAARAKAGKFKLDDFGGGTFTVDNTGYLGTNLVMPILNVPEVGIVTMEAITKRPVVVATPDGDVIAIRPVMNMVLGVDHRANDGAGGAALLRDIKAWLEKVGPDTAIY
ncbi:MAG TPA: dihydrolipoamide acetyltransferase family protein [Candidatus Bathyarchaeia archaeon]|nr:dihydrolipoamide acetyltransferase family protein [Candidatus Bathyarchaeia archaeon]